MSKYTPGQWAAFDSLGNCLDCDGWEARHEGNGSTAWQPIKAPGGEVVALVVKRSEDHWSSLDTGPYARLLAAAPELLGVAQGFRQKLTTYVSVYPGDKQLRRLLEACDAAISKATGESA